MAPRRGGPRSTTPTTTARTDFCHFNSSVLAPRLSLFLFSNCFYGCSVSRGSLHGRGSRIRMYSSPSCPSLRRRILQQWRFAKVKSSLPRRFSLFLFVTDNDNIYILLVVLLVKINFTVVICFGDSPNKQFITHSRKGSYYVVNNKRFIVVGVTSPRQTHYQSLIVTSPVDSLSEDRSTTVPFLGRATSPTSPILCGRKGNTPGPNEWKGGGQRSPKLRDSTEVQEGKGEEGVPRGVSGRDETSL